MNTYLQLRDKHKGQTAFILGCGPSLYSFYKSKKTCWGIFDTNVVIAVNSSIIMAVDKLKWYTGNDYYRYFISNDSLCMRWSWWVKVQESKCIKIVRNSWEKYKDQLEGFLFFEPRPTKEDVINSDDIGLAYCASIPSAIDLSIQMGVKKILLFGVDHCTIDGKDHFWQYFHVFKQPFQVRPAQGSFSQQKKVFDFSIGTYKALKEFADNKKCKIYNCSINSELDIFEKIQFDDYLKRKD